MGVSVGTPGAAGVALTHRADGAAGAGDQRCAFLCGTAWQGAVFSVRLAFPVDSHA